METTSESLKGPEKGLFVSQEWANHGASREVWPAPKTMHETNTGFNKLISSGQNSGKQNSQISLFTGTVSRGLTSQQTQHTLRCV